MPRQVDHDERRRAIADAVFVVIATRGLTAVSLRDVAAAAGVSMGAVQHYFTSKDQMLLFALRHLRARVLARLEERLSRLERPSTRQRVRLALGVLLPVDEPGRQEAAVNVAFFSVATVRPDYAALLRDGFDRLLAASGSQLRAAAAAGELRDGVDVAETALALLLQVQGLVGPVLVGLVSPDEAFVLLDRRLDQIFR